MYYEINISKSGHHFFTTDSLRDYEEAKNLCTELEKRFRAPEFVITCVRWVPQGEVITF